MSTFYAPGRANPGPDTQCYACGAPRREHDRNGFCRVREVDPHSMACPDGRGGCALDEPDACPVAKRPAQVTAIGGGEGGAS